VPDRNFVLDGYRRDEAIGGGANREAFGAASAVNVRGGEEERNGSGSLRTGKARKDSRKASLGGSSPRPCKTSWSTGPQVAPLTRSSSVTRPPNFPLRSSIQIEVSVRITELPAGDARSHGGAAVRLSAFHGGRLAKDLCQRIVEGIGSFESEAVPPELG